MKALLAVKLTKEQEKELTPAGWGYIGVDGVCHLFQKDLKRGCALMRCLNEDMTADKLVMMANSDIQKLIQSLG